MRKKTILFFLFIVFFISAFEQKPNENYIKLQYNGDRSKPYSKILLYMKGSNEPKTDTLFTYKLEISKESFEIIENSINERKNIIKDSSLIKPYSYEFIVSHNGETMILLTPYLTTIRNLFNVIKNQIKNSNKQLRVKELLDDIISRLKYDNNLN